MESEELLGTLEALIIFGAMGCSNLYIIYTTTSKFMLVINSFLGIVSFYIVIWSIVLLVKNYKK